MHHRTQKSQNKQYTKRYNSNLPVNSHVSKFDELKVIGQGIFHILIINERKLHASFPVNQVLINSFSTPYKLDRNRNGGGIIILQAKC